MVRFWLLLISLALLTGCDLLGDSLDQPTQTATPAIPTPADTPRPEPTPAGGAAPEATPDGPLALNLWMMPDVAPRGELRGGTTLSQQLAAFDSSHPDLELNVEVKTIADPGGALNYLRTGRDIAPSIMPDLLLLPANLLEDAVAQGLVFPLDDLISEGSQEALFPVASNLSRVDDTVYGYPALLTNLQHAVHNPTVITGTLPTTWSELSTTPASFVFPAEGREGAELVLQMYLTAGGQLVDSNDRLMLEFEQLALVLEALEEARREGIIVAQSSNLLTLEESWQAFQNQTANAAQTTAAQFLSKRAIGFDSGFGRLPGVTDPVVPRVSGRLWVLTTADPVQQALAVELIDWLTIPENLGAYTAESTYLPPRADAFQVWPEDAYTAFLQELLAEAQPYPDQTSNQLLSVLNTAVSDVISLSKSGEVAAEEAVAEFAP